MSVYIYQFISMFVQTQLNISMDLFGAYMMYVASIKFEILGARLVKLGNINETRLNNIRNVKPGISRNNQWIQQDFEQKKVLIKCVVSYQKISL